MAQKPNTKKDGLNDNQKAFVKWYVALKFNGEKAAIKAGYSPSGARQAASRMLTKSNIIAAIDIEKAKAVKKVELTEELVINELKNMILFDPRKLYDDDGNLKPIKDLDDDIAKSLAGLKVLSIRADDNGNTTLTKEVKWYDKQKSIELAMRYLGLFIDQKKITMEGELNTGKMDLSKLNTEELAALAQISTKLKKDDDE